jgi:hypothetical protein
MFSFSTECNPRKALRIVNVAGKNKESVSSDGRLFPQTVMEELPTNQELTTMAGDPQPTVLLFRKKFFSSSHGRINLVPCFIDQALERTFQSVGHEQELGLAIS